MSSSDPRVLIPLLMDLQQVLLRGTLEYHDTLVNADLAQRHLVEHGQRFTARVRALETLSEEDERYDRQTLDAVETAEARSRDTIERTSQAFAKSRYILGKANLARDRWQSEVARAAQRVTSAPDWVSRAETAVAAAQYCLRVAAEALEKARKQVADAKAAVANCRQAIGAAQSQLAAAQAALAACLQPVYSVDSRGNQQVSQRDCSGCYAAVAAATAAVADAEHAFDSACRRQTAVEQEQAKAEQEKAAAQSQLAATLADLADARAELAAAEQDLMRCEANLAIAVEAVGIATAAVGKAKMATATAAESADAVAAARVPAEAALALNMRQHELCTQLDVLSRLASDALDHGEGELHQARSHSNAAADGVHACNNDLSLRVDHLLTLETSRDFA